jgi:GTPase Era involved in 16S rRNA processing
MDCIRKNLNKIDILFYITNAETAFQLTTEYDLFCRLRRMLTSQMMIKLCVVVNKFDDITDVDMSEIYKKAHSKLLDASFYRFACINLENHGKFPMHSLRNLRKY